MHKPYEGVAPDMKAIHFIIIQDNEVLIVIADYCQLISRYIKQHRHFLIIPACIVYRTRGYAIRFKKRVTLFFKRVRYIVPPVIEGQVSVGISIIYLYGITYLESGKIAILPAVLGS